MKTKRTDSNSTKNTGKFPERGNYHYTPKKKQPKKVRHGK